VFLGSLAAVCGAVWWRLATGDGQAVTRRIPAVAASVAVPLVVLGWLAAGPLRSGWSARAGTPTPSGAVTSVSPSSLAALSAPFSATLSGTASQTAPDSAGDATVTMSATLSGPVSAVLGVRLTGHALSTGGVSLTSSSASLGTAAQPTLDVGQVTSLSGDRLKLVLSGATKAIYASVNVTIDGTGNLSGAIQTSTTPA
jgi:hypothetical protein